MNNERDKNDKKEKKWWKTLKKIFLGEKKYTKKEMNTILFVSVTITIILLGLLYIEIPPKTGTLEYNDFWVAVSDGQIDSVVYSKSSSIFEVVYVEDPDLLVDESRLSEVYKIDDGRRVETLLNPSEDGILQRISESGVVVKEKSAQLIDYVVGLLSLVPMVVMVALMYYMIKKMIPTTKTERSGNLIKMKFDDVAGLTEEKEELKLAIDSLKNPWKFKDKGVKPIKGVLFEGPPGVGKTLLAKALAGESNVSFLYYSGSDFVEMYVGLGAKRVREMLKKARECRPCIVFIDEIDAVGRKRSGAGGGGEQESDQTLLALLEGMDGVSDSSGIMFIGATNRLNHLDKALLRAGRFDKILHIGVPSNKEDRESIVRVHMKGKSFLDDVSVEEIAKQCMGMSGADISAMLNDAVLESFKNGKSGCVSMVEIESAVMKILVSGVVKGRHSKKDRHRTAIHESGHALMYRYFDRSVSKIGIQPYSSGVGGVTISSDGEDIRIKTKGELEEDIMVLYGGKVAEEILLGESSIGSSNDLERATLLINSYVGSLGMSSSSLAYNVLKGSNALVGGGSDTLTEMKELAEKLYAKTVNIVEMNKGVIETLTLALEEEETLYSSRVEELCKDVKRITE